MYIRIQIIIHLSPKGWKRTRPS